MDHGRRQTAEVDHAAVDDTARSGQTVEAGRGRMADPGDGAWGQMVSTAGERHFFK